MHPEAGAPAFPSTPSRHAWWVGEPRQGSGECWETTAILSPVLSQPLGLNLPHVQ